MKENKILKMIIVIMFAKNKVAHARDGQEIMTKNSKTIFSENLIDMRKTKKRMLMTNRYAIICLTRCGYDLMFATSSYPDPIMIYNSIYNMIRM